MDEKNIGNVQRRILDELERRGEFVLNDLLPPGVVWPMPDYMSLHRAARTLDKRGLIVMTRDKQRTLIKPA